MRMFVSRVRPRSATAGWLIAGSLLVVSLSWAGSARAQDEDPNLDELDAPAEPVPAPPPAEEAPPPEPAPADTSAPAPGDGDAVEQQLEASVEEGEKMEEASARRITEEDIGEDMLEEFELTRGFYLASDLGVFLTLGGTRGYSNVQPYLAAKIGYDIGDYFSVQANVSTAYSSGNPVTPADRPAGDPFGTNNFDATRDYGIINAGLEVVAAIRPTQRVAIEPHIGGGYSFIDPPISHPASSATAVSKFTGHAGHIVAGVDFKYLTLLTGFTAGAGINFYGIIGEGGGYFIPSLGISAVVRYTPVFYGN